MITLNIEWNNLRRVLNEFADYVIQLAKDNLGRNRSYASGTLADTMTKEIRIDTNRYSVWIGLQPYWDYVEYGRKPGKFPPPNRIKEWIRVKPIKPRSMTITRKWKTKSGEHSRRVTITPSVEQLAFLIGRKIATKGIAPKPFFNPAVEDAKARFEEAINLAIDTDVQEWIVEKVLKQELYNQLFGVL